MCHTQWEALSGTGAPPSMSAPALGRGAGSAHESACNSCSWTLQPAAPEGCPAHSYCSHLHQRTVLHTRKSTPTATQPWQEGAHSPHMRHPWDTWLGWLGELALLGPLGYLWLKATSSRPGDVTNPLNMQKQIYSNWEAKMRQNMFQRKEQNKNLRKRTEQNGD